MKLSDKELRLLGALLRRKDEGRADTSATIPDLMNRQYLERREPQGYHQTAASLVRKGLVFKGRRAGLVTYRVSPLGSATLRGMDRQSEANRARLRERDRSLPAADGGPRVMPL